jgi:hypothetical protein
MQPLLAAEGGAFISAMYVAEEDARNRSLIGDCSRIVRRGSGPSSTIS